VTVKAVTCEYDGTVLVLTPEGKEPECPACAIDIEAHTDVCRTCRLTLAAAAEA
jgi:hypothetical protein